MILDTVRIFLTICLGGLTKIPPIKNPKEGMEGAGFLCPPLFVANGCEAVTRNYSASFERLMRNRAFFM
jgi:hypothetical protein